MSAVVGGGGNERTAADNLDDTNQKDQLDEVKALESIYSDTPECFSYSVSKDYKVTGSISIILPRIDNEITVYADAACRREWVRKAVDNGVPFYKRHRLSKILTDSWTDYRGMPVLFTWIELLKEEALEIVMSQSRINLNEIFSSEEDIKKGLSEHLKTLTEYDEQAMQNEFECEWYDCEVCFSSKSGKECIKFMPCGHIYCIECVSEYYRQKLRDNMIRQLECLNEGCESTAMQRQIRQVLTDEEFEAYEQRLLEGTLDLMSDVVICPRISCQAPVIVDDGTSSLARCSLCHYSFCILCRKTYHGVEPCSLTVESREKLLDQLENATASEREEIYRRFGGQKEFERRLEIMKSEQWIESNSKACPSCHAKIEKNDGCNKMRCSKCGNHFCWLCGVILNKKDPYSHFNMPGSKRCYNRLFEGVIDEEDEEWFLGDSDSEDED